VALDGPDSLPAGEAEFVAPLLGTTALGPEEGIASLPSPCPQPTSVNPSEAQSAALTRLLARECSESARCVLEVIAKVL
jgi:hypothetical protein